MKDELEEPEEIEQEEEESDELYEHHRIEVDKGQQPERIDKYIVNHVKHLSRNKVQKAAKAECLLVNDEPVKVNYKVRPNDVISLVLPQPRRQFKMVPEKMDLNIVYEDDDVMVINKPAGLVVHPGFGNWTGTLSHGIAYHLGNLVESEDLDPMRPGIVHRIDKYTSGLLVVGKNDNAIQHLSNQFFHKTVDRIYHAIAWGNFEEPEGTVHTNIGRHQKNRKVFTTYNLEEEGKHAITHYKVLEDLGYVSYVECQLETGRTHQIRVHMQHLGNPLFADGDYGGDKIVKGTVFTKYRQFVENAFNICGRQALHAKTLAFTHPRTGERLSFNSDLADDMQEVLIKWRNYSKQLKR